MAGGCVIYIPNCVFVCMCYRPPVRAVCSNHEVVVFQPRTVTDPYLGSVANITTIIALMPHLFQPCSGSLSPPLDLSPIAPPYFTHRCHFFLSLHPLYPTPHLARSWSDRPPGRPPHPLTSTACLKLLPMTGGPRSSLSEPVTASTHTVSPPLPSSTCNQVPVGPRGSLVRG